VRAGLNAVRNNVDQICFADRETTVRRVDDVVCGYE
jgi:hypothetical protein